MKKIGFILVFMAMLCIAGCALADIQAYPVPAGTPTERVLFEITANGLDVGVYSDLNMKNLPVNFAYFNFDPGDEVTVRIRSGIPFEKVDILPARDDLEWSVDGRIITVKMTNPGDDLTFVFNDNYQGATLHLFTNEIDHEAQAKRKKFGTIYYGPGYHDLTHTQVKVGSGQTLYVDAGAVVNGPIVVENSKNVTIEGTGVIMMTQKSAVNPQYGNIVITLNHASNVTIKNVIANSHRTQNWTTHVYFSDNVLIENYKVVSTRYASVDALDISNSQNVTVKDCFLRSCDDCITIKGLGQSKTPDGSPPNEHIHVSGCVLWNDCNNAMVVGEESFAAYYDDISFKDIDVLYSYDDRDNHGKLEERAVMSIVTLHGTEITNILWEDIRVNNCQRLICFRFVDSFWFGSIQGDQSLPGFVDGVTVRNVTCNSNNKDKIANEILLYGWSKDKQLMNLTFENVMVNGRKFNSLVFPKVKTNSHVRNIRFK
ncbi:MAG: hypothetical protein E7324_00685 [Clostridiales bacterium]|nr:hypothetical protein [Clostridiales bacterium]